MGARTLIAGLLGVAMAISPALAATVTPGLGQVFVNRGQGFQPLAGPSEANPGDQLMVSPGGTATVLFGDGCSMNLQPGGVMTVSSVSPCASPYAQQEPPPPQQTPDLNPWLFGAGIAAAGAGFGYWIYTTVSASP